MSHIVFNRAEWWSESGPIYWGGLRCAVEPDAKVNGVFATAVRFGGVDNPTHVQPAPQESR